MTNDEFIVAKENAISISNVNISYRNHYSRTSLSEILGRKQSHRRPERRLLEQVAGYLQLLNLTSLQGTIWMHIKLCRAVLIFFIEAAD
jgi:hypothetical protein